jgi:hypothetical protein
MTNGYPLGGLKRRFTTHWLSWTLFLYTLSLDWVDEWVEECEEV